MESPSLASSFRHCTCTGRREFRVVLGCTGSVAAIKVPDLVREINDRAIGKSVNVQIRLVPTQRALHFFDPEPLKQLDNLEVFQDEDEWSSWQVRGDPVLHIELRKWADLMVIAPLDANTLAKIATGLCDNLLTCTVRAWDIKGQKPLLFAPAMNTAMWDHPITAEQVTRLESWGFEAIPPISKTLICGDVGVGAMENPDRIADRVLEKLLQPP